jgi:hypothetical protein
MAEPKDPQQPPAVVGPDVPAAVVVDPPQWEKEVETWFQDTRLSFPHLETEVHNQLFAAKEALKARLRSLFA